MKGLSNTIIWLVTLLFSVVSVSAQETAEVARVVVSGVVTDASTGRPVPQATIAVAGTHVSVVSNDDGFFTLKAAAMPQGIVVSCMPIVLGLAMTVLKPATMKPFIFSLKGAGCIGLALALVIVGWLFIRKITKIEV